MPNHRVLMSLSRVLQIYVENDRKANMEVLESTKGANKDEIRRLREDSKELRQKLTALMKVRLIEV